MRLSLRRVLGAPQTILPPALPTAAVLAALVACGGPDGAPDATTSPRNPRAAFSHSPSSIGNRPKTIAAVGDSITRGFDACSVLTDCLQASWVTGTDRRVDSLASRLRPEVTDDQRAASPSASTVPDSWNFAKSGARMEELPEQIERAVEKKPYMVAVLMGANDACRRNVSAMTPVAEFRESFEESLDLLARELPRARVFVASIPDLEQLWRVGRQNPQAKQVWRLGICPSMLDRPDSLARHDVERRARVGERVERYNEVLEEVCEQYPMCRHDGGAVHRYRFSADELSPWDWFHPSVRGQAQLARIAFEAAFEE